MKLGGTIEVAAAPRDVWAVVIDPRALAGCVPGVQELRQVDDHRFEGSLTAAVGPLEGDFVFTAVIAREHFPDDLQIEVDGTDSVTRSRVEAQVGVRLDGSATSTTLTYAATLDVRGRLAILGEMVLRATAGLMIEHASRCLRSVVESRSGETTGGAAISGT